MILQVFYLLNMASLVFIVSCLVYYILLLSFRALLFIGCGSISCYYIYKSCIKPYIYWDIRNAIYETPWPLFGNLAPFIFQRQSLVDLHNEIYKKDKYKER